MQTSSGGAAAVRGFDFQHRVTAWVAVHILAEKAASPPWGLPADITLEWLRCETEQPVDDLLVGTSGSGLVFVQIKRSLSLSEGVNSELASSLDQFVRQFIACRNKAGDPNPTDRPLDPAKDRLVLVTSSASSQPIRVHLPRVFRRLRNLTPGQAIGKAATNASECHALSVVLKHIRRSWQAVMNSEPSDEELSQLLSLIDVQVLDVENGGTDEREAKNLLRSVVLRNPDEAERAWSQLITLCARYAANRSGADRIILQQELLNAGFDLRAPRSYEADIDKLRRHSSQTLEALAHLAQIKTRSTTVKIHRACTEALRRAAEEGSLLVVGEPGAGKSGALHDFVEALHKEGRDYVYFAVDQVAAQNLGELRQELGLEHEFLDVLKNWTGRQPAFLVIDALDAARGDTTGKMIRNLIRQVVEAQGRWQVVASIRKFDLRYGEELQQLFAGTPPTEFIDPEFRKVRHLNVPRLSDDELNEVGSQSPQLLRLVEKASAEFRELLRVPFNLRLLAELLDFGVSVDDLTPIGTQIELLDRYWHYRVLRSDDMDDMDDARESVLREVCEEMVRKRALRVDRSAVARSETSKMLKDLLSTQILVEWQPSPEARPDRYVLAFSHHVLFDYAVARLLFRGDDEKIIKRLATEPDLVIFVRPSLVLHFTHIWHWDQTRRAFWDLTFRFIQAEGIPQIGKLIGPTVAAELARTLADLEPLCTALEADEKPTQEAAEKALGHLVGALLAQEDVGGLVGPDAGLWCALLDRVSERSLRKPIAYMVRSLLMMLCDHVEKFTLEQKEAVGCTARRLLEFAWSQELRDPWLVAHALQCVCRTFDSDPDSSASLIRRAIEPQHLAQYGFEELPWLAREVEWLFSDPSLVADIYRAAFSYQEESDEPTLIGGSRILPLISNRHQDYRLALYKLAEAFPKFLKSAPQEATSALMGVTQAYVEQRHPLTSGEWREETFDFGGRITYLRMDYSSIWDEGGDDDPVKMLNAFQNFLEELAAQENKRSELRRIVEIIVAENRLAVVWRRLLIAGSRYPETLGMEILPLAWALPVLTCMDTTVAVGEFIKAIFPLLGADQRQRIEEAILNIPKVMAEDQREIAEEIRNRLLGCLVPEVIVTDEAREMLQGLQARNAIPVNEPFFRVGPVERLPYGEEEYLRDQGVPVETEPNRKIRELEQPVKEFANQHLNSAPTIEEANAVLPRLCALHDALARADADGVHPKQKNYAWGILAQACACIARAKNISCHGELGKFVKAILLEASCCPEPLYDPQYDVQFEELPSWGSPAARIDAAEGLIMLARHPNCATPEVLSTIEKLSNDPVPAVRFQIATRLGVLHRTAPDLMWRIIERMAREEKNRGVLQGLLVGSLKCLAAVKPDRVAELTKIIFNRFREGPEAEKIREFCILIFGGLYIWRNHFPSREIVREIISDPVTYPSEANHVLGLLREALTYGPTDVSDPQADAVRQRAFSILSQLLTSAVRNLKDIEARYEGKAFNEWPKEDQETFRSLMRLVSGIASEVYFASGAYDAKQNQKRAGRVQGITPQSKRFYCESGEILDQLTKLGFPDIAHHLLETLEYFIPADPQGVFLRIHRVVLSAQKEGYQYEPLAVDLIVRIVERYLAEYRTHLQQSEDCRRALIEILDVFVEAGWPSARRLVYRLEEIYR